MGNTNIKEVRKFRQDCEVVEMYVDGDLYKITEEYKDDQGEVVYIYEYYPTPGQILKAQKERVKKQYKTENKINKKLDRIKNRQH